MANSWILNRLREIEEESKEWPAWVFEQPLSRRDAEKIARGERLRSAPMASEDVLHRYAAMLLSGGSSRTADAAMMEALAAEVRELRADLVWSVRKGVMVSHDENLRPCVWLDVHRGVECDGTPESICRAVREARDGS